MASTPKSEQEREATITRLVDGTLPDDQRAAAERWASGDPGAARELARQRAVARELRASGPVPPQHLLASIRRLQDGPPARRSAPRWRPAAAVGAFAAAAAVVVALLLSGGSSASPSISAAAKLAFAPATAPAPVVRDARYLSASYGGVTYPNYLRAFGAVPTGQRVDHIGGRAALTVFYRLSDGSRLSYTVFSGSPVPLPAGTSTVVAYGVPMHVFHASGLAVVTLVRFGRTCVLAAPVSSRAVVALATAPLRA